MRQEFGRWFLDVAKYILTALLLSSFFGEMNNIYYTILAFCIFALCLLVGALLLNPNLSLGLAWILFFRRVNFVWLLMSNSELLRTKSRQKTPYKNKRRQAVIKNQTKRPNDSFGLTEKIMIKLLTVGLMVVFAIIVALVTIKKEEKDQTRTKRWTLNHVQHHKWVKENYRNSQRWRHSRMSSSIHIQ